MISTSALVCLHFSRSRFSYIRQILPNRLIFSMNHLNCISTKQNGATREDDLPTVGVIVIGDEILKGQTQDTNSCFLAKRLFSMGVRVKKISVIGDDLDIIAKEVAEFSHNYTHVITSGGIGPTHDDLTLEGVARAFNVKVTPHPDMVKLCLEFFGTDDLTSPKLKLAYVPENCELCYGIDKRTGGSGKFPVVKMKNVYVLPGIPRLFTSAFDRLEGLFRNPSAEFNTRYVYISLDEASITGVLNEVNEQYKDKVILGSYPELNSRYYKVKLSLESRNNTHLTDMINTLTAQLPVASVVNYDPEPLVNAGCKVYSLAGESFLKTNGCTSNHEVHETNGSAGYSSKVTTNGESMAQESNVSACFGSKLRESLRVVEQALNRYDMCSGEIAVGFNGGKDCTALLHLVHAVNQHRAQPAPHLTVLYIRHGQSFPETELFVNRCKQNYKLEFINATGNIRQSLEALKVSHPRLKAVLMGTRHSDPHSSNLNPFSPTDPDWPDYMRVNPLLEWSYGDIWAFIRNLSLDYCSLYDSGYTSLGSMENTHPNPLLREVDSKGNVTYRPAYSLKDEGLERAGRNTNKL